MALAGHSVCLKLRIIIESGSIYRRENRAIEPSRKYVLTFYHCSTLPQVEERRDALGGFVGHAATCYEKGPRDATPSLVLGSRPP